MTRERLESVLVIAAIVGLLLHIVSNEIKFNHVNLRLDAHEEMLRECQGEPK